MSTTRKAGPMFSDPELEAVEENIEAALEDEQDREDSEGIYADSDDLDVNGDDDLS